MDFRADQLAELDTATARGGDEQIEIQLGHLCNNRCVFCVSGQMTALKMARLIPLDPVRDALQDGAARGVRRVTFLGGEPTMQPSFLPALALARELGFTDVVVFTNGVRLTQEAFVDEVVAIIDCTWRISIQGGNEPAHVDVTGRPASFRRIVDGMRILRARGQRITTNLCLNVRNADSLPDFVPLVREHGIEQLHIDLMRPQDAGSRSDDELIATMGRYGAMAPAIDRMLTDFEAWDPDFDVNIGNLPFCVLPRWADRIHHGGQTTRTFAADGRGGISAPWDKYAHQASDKVHRDACDRCAFRDRCAGAFQLYVDRWGWDELEPVPLASLAALDDRRGAFDLTVVPLLEPLQADPPGGRFLERRHDHRERRVDLVYDLGTLAVHPPPGRRRSRVPRPAARGPELWLDGPDTLVDWACSRLTVPLERVRPPDPRALARVVRLVQACRTATELAGWRLVSVRRTEDGAALRWRRDGDIVLILRAGAGARPDLRVEGDARPELVQPLLDAVADLARRG